MRLLGSTSQNVGPASTKPIGALRALWRPDGAPFVGRFYSTEGLTLLPEPAQPGGPPIWIGSWGSEAGLRRVARLADGWLASAYNTTPATFGEAWPTLRSNLTASGRDPDTFPNALATMWCYITDDQRDADRVLQRSGDAHRAPTGGDAPRAPPDRAGRAFAEKLQAFADAGVQRVYIWPVADEVNQLERFWNEVRPLVAG